MDEEERMLRERVATMTAEQIAAYKARLTERISNLSLADKRLVKLYLQSPIEELIKKRDQFLNRDNNPAESVRQSQLYMLAYQLKLFNMSITGGKSRRRHRRRRMIKKKLTRRK